MAFYGLFLNIFVVNKISFQMVRYWMKMNAYWQFYITLKNLRRQRVSLVCVCVRMCVCVRVCVRMCVCVREREKRECKWDRYRDSRPYCWRENQIFISSRIFAWAELATRRMFLLIKASILIYKLKPREKERTNQKTSLWKWERTQILLTDFNFNAIEDNLRLECI